MDKIKNIFREVSPEATDFSFYFDDDGIKEAGGDYCYNLFIVTFDRWGRIEGFQAEEYKEISQMLSYIEQDFSNVKTGDGWSNYGSYKEVMEAYGLHYTPNKCHELKELIFGSSFDSSDPDTVAAFLTIKTGKPWDTVSARGYSQGDYCQVLYCKDFHSNPKAYGEIWLGAGREFMYIALDDDGNEIERVGGYIIADCQAWRDEDYKRLLCEWEGVKPEEAALEMIDGSHTWTEYEYRTA